MRGLQHSLWPHPTWPEHGLYISVTHTRLAALTLHTLSELKTEIEGETAATAARREAQVEPLWEDSIMLSGKRNWAYEGLSCDLLSAAPCCGCNWFCADRIKRVWQTPWCVCYLGVQGAGLPTRWGESLLSESVRVASTTLASTTMSSMEKHTGLHRAWSLSAHSHFISRGLVVMVRLIRLKMADGCLV